MKKIVFMAMMAFACGNAAFANEKGNAYVNFDIELDAYSIVRDLNITDSQRSSRVCDACYLFRREMEDVMQVRNSQRGAMVVDVVYMNLRRMKSILTTDEYRRYLQGLNRKLEANNLAQFFD